MSGTVETRMHRTEAVEIAKAFVAELDGTYDQLIVAGSLRRRLAYCGDVEIVAVPKVEQQSDGLFEDMATAVDRLDARMMALLDNDELAQRRKSNGDLMAWGPTWKSVTFRGRPIDLFTPCAERLGWILILRTGPAAFSRQLVVPKRDDNGRPGRTKDRRPGLLPIHIKSVDGWLCYRTSGERIPTPTEQSVFDLFNIPYIEPWSRS
jgi:DNA polymerase/3'-5' exonuclease PolX